MSEEKTQSQNQEQNQATQQTFGLFGSKTQQNDNLNQGSQGLFGTQNVQQPQQQQSLFQQQGLQSNQQENEQQQEQQQQNEDQQQNQLQTKGLFNKANMNVNIQNSQQNGSLFSNSTLLKNDESVQFNPDFSQINQNQGLFGQSQNQGQDSQQNQGFFGNSGGIFQNNQSEQINPNFSQNNQSQGLFGQSQNQNQQQKSKVTLKKGNQLEEEQLKQVLYDQLDILNEAISTIKTIVPLMKLQKSELDTATKPVIEANAFLRTIPQPNNFFNQNQDDNEENKEDSGEQQNVGLFGQNNEQKKFQPFKFNSGLSNNNSIQNTGGSLSGGNAFGNNDQQQQLQQGFNFNNNNVQNQNNFSEQLSNQLNQDQNQNQDKNQNQNQNFGLFKNQSVINDQKNYSPYDVTIEVNGVESQLKEKITISQKMSIKDFVFRCYNSFLDNQSSQYEDQFDDIYDYDSLQIELISLEDDSQIVIKDSLFVDLEEPIFSGEFKINIKQKDSKN